MVISCFFCNKKGSLSFIKSHIRIKHKFVTSNFFCNQNKCLRTFENVKSAFAHIRKSHKVLLNKAHQLCDENNSETTNINNSETTNHSTEGFLYQCECEKITFSEELLFVLRQYKKPNLTRFDINTIICETKELFDCESDRYHNFCLLDSEHKRIKQLTKLNLFSKPETIVLRYEQKIRKNTNTIQIPITAQYNKLEDIFKLVFSCKENLLNALKYIEEKNDINYYCDLKDGELFADLEKYVLPYILYYDEVESGNPLGSHKGLHKIGAIYLALKCSPPQQCSSLDAIYNCVLFPANNKEHLSYIMERLVIDINKLYDNGIVIHGIQLKFKFAGIIGDNLGLHQALGFIESFSANYPCRFCSAPKEVLKVMNIEDISLLRNIDNYETHLDMSNPSATGINKNSVFNQIVGFHVTKNYYADIMHDVLEGVANWGMSHIIKYFVVEKLFSIEELNNRLKMFDFGLWMSLK